MALDNWFVIALVWIMERPMLGVSDTTQMACSLGGIKGKGRLGASMLLACSDVYYSL